MYIMIKTITMRHSRKRKTLRLPISPTSPHREVANRHSFNSAFLLPGFLRWPLARLALSYPLRHVLSNSNTAILQDEAELPKLPPLFFFQTAEPDYAISASLYIKRSVFSQPRQGSVID